MRHKYLPDTMPLWKKILLGVLGVAVLAAAAFVWRIGPRNVLGMIRYDQRREGDLLVGHAAPDVSVVALDGVTRRPLLPAERDRPLVLVFGSYT